MGVSYFIMKQSNFLPSRLSITDPAATSCLLMKTKHASKSTTFKLLSRIAIKTFETKQSVKTEFEVHKPLVARFLCNSGGLLSFLSSHSIAAAVSYPIARSSRGNPDTGRPSPFRFDNYRPGVKPETSSKSRNFSFHTAQRETERIRQP